MEKIGGKGEFWASPPQYCPCYVHLLQTKASNIFILKFSYLPRLPSFQLSLQDWHRQPHTPCTSSPTRCHPSVTDDRTVVTCDIATLSPELEIKLNSTDQISTAPYSRNFRDAGHCTCERPAQSCYLAMRQPGIEPATCWLQVQHPNHCITEPPI